MGQSDFYRFEPEEPLATYGLAREALQFLTDNYWKNIGDEARKALVLPGAFPERNFHYSLMQAVNGTKTALERWPEDSQLLKILPIFERSLKRIGHTESLAIQLLYGEDLIRLHSNIGDYAAEEFLREARVMLDGLIDTGDKSFTGELYRAYGEYQTYVEELVKLYDGKREQMDSRVPHSSSLNPPRKRYRLHELYDRQEERYQELWLNGLLDGRDYNMPPDGV